MTSNFVRATQIFPTLPPRLSGRLRGRLCVKVDEVLWTRKSPGDIIVLVKWWGEFESTEFRPVDVSKNSRVDAPDTILVYNIRSSLDVIESYLKEVKTLKLNVIDANTRIVVGVVTIPNVTAVLFENPYEKYFPIKNCYGNTIGELHFGLKISYKDKCGKLKTIVPYLKSRKLVSKLVKKRCIKPATDAQKKKNDNTMSEPDPLQETLVQPTEIPLANCCFEEPPGVQPRTVLLSKILEKSQMLRKSIVKNNVPFYDEHVPFTNGNNDVSSQPTETYNQLATHGKCIYYSCGQAGRCRTSVTETSTRATSLPIGRPRTSLANEEENRPKFSTGINSKADGLPMAKDSNIEQKMEGVPHRQTINLLSYTNCMKITCKNLALNNVGLRKVWVSNQNSSCRSVIQRKARSYLPVTFQNVQIQPPGATYFVEYEFPHFLITSKPIKKQKYITCRPWATKMQRFCSNKQVGNFIQFEQSCTHNLAQTRGDLQDKLKATTIVFSVFSRHLNQRLPTFIGKAQLRLLDLCQKKFLSQVQNIPVMFSSGLQKCKVHLGSLAVKIELGVDKIYFGPEFSRCIKLRLLEERSEDSLSTYPDLSEDKESKPCPVSTVSTSTTDLPKEIPSILQQDILLHGLIKISFGRNFDMSRLYLLSRAFWKDDAVISDISYETEVQNFNFHELIPVLLSRSLLERSRNNILVTEVRKRNRNGADYLIGMAKLPLHQFYISYRDPAVVDKLLQAKYPVIAVDGWVNVTDPISQNPVGQLQVLLALGTEDQVKSLEQSRLTDFIPNYRAPSSYRADRRDVPDGVPNLQERGTGLKCGAKPSHSTGFVENHREPAQYHENEKDACNSLPNFQERGIGLKHGVKPSHPTGFVENHQEPVQYHENKKNACNSPPSLQERKDTVEPCFTSHPSEDRPNLATGTQKVKSTGSMRKKRQLNTLRAHFRSGKGVNTKHHAENQVVSDSDSMSPVELRSQGVQTDLTMARVTTFGEISQALTPKVQVKENSRKKFQSTMSQTDLVNLPDRFDSQVNAGNQSTDNHIGNQSSASIQLSDNHIGNQSSTSIRLSDTHSGNQRVSSIGNPSDTKNHMSDNQTGKSNRLSDNRIGNQIDKSMQLSDHTGYQIKTSNGMPDCAGSQLGSINQSCDIRTSNQNNTSNQLSDNCIGNHRDVNNRLSDNRTGNQLDNQLSDNPTRNQLGSRNQLPDANYLPANQSDTSIRLTDNHTGNQLGNSNQLSDNRMTSRSDGTNTQLDVIGKVPANHMVTVLSAIDNLLDTSKQLSSGLEMHLGAIKSLPLSDNVEIRLNTLNRPPKGHNPHYSQEKNSQTTTCYSEIPTIPSIVLSEPQVVKNPPFFRAHIEIENALHLPGIMSECRRRQSETNPGAVDVGTYVTFQLDQGCQNIVYSSINEMTATHIVHNTVNPSWNWHCDTIIPQFLLTDVSKRLVFKVWQSEGSSKCPDTVRDSVLGFAVVDLTVLLFGLPWISGWFNIMDFTGRCNGQIKINITPLENLARFTISNSNELYKCERVNGNIQGYEQFSDHNPPKPGEGGDSGGGFTMQEGMDDTVSPSFLSKALKEKFSELDVITLRLKQRLQVVTSDDDISHLHEDEPSAIYSNPVSRISQSPRMKTSSRDVEYQSSHTQTQHYVDTPSMPATSREAVRTDLNRPCQGGNAFSARQVAIEAECSQANDEDGDVNDFDVLTDYLMESAAREIELEKVFSAVITKSDEEQDDGNQLTKSPTAQLLSAIDSPIVVKGSNSQSQVSLDVVQMPSLEDGVISVPHNCESAKRLQQEIISQLSGLENRFVYVGTNYDAAHPKQSHGGTYSHKKHQLSPIESLSGSVHNLSEGGEQDLSSDSSLLDTSNNNVLGSDDLRPSPVGGNLLEEPRVSPPAPTRSQANCSAQDVSNDGSGSQGKLSKDQQSVVMNTEEVRRLAQIFSTKRGGP